VLYFFFAPAFLLADFGVLGVLALPAAFFGVAFFLSAAFFAGDDGFFLGEEGLAFLGDPSAV